MKWWIANAFRHKQSGHWMGFYIRMLNFELSVFSIVVLVKRSQYSFHHKFSDAYTRTGTPDSITQSNATALTSHIVMKLTYSIIFRLSLLIPVNGNFWGCSCLSHHPYTYDMHSKLVFISLKLWNAVCQTCTVIAIVVTAQAEPAESFTDEDLHWSYHYS